MDDETTMGATTASFVSRLGSTLGEGEAVDRDLASILTEHILSVEPEQDAVEKAKQAILELAGRRAAKNKTEKPLD